MLILSIRSNFPYIVLYFNFSTMNKNNLKKGEGLRLGIFKTNFLKLSYFVSKRKTGKIIDMLLTRIETKWSQEIKFIKVKYFGYFFKLLEYKAF